MVLIKDFIKKYPFLSNDKISNDNVKVFKQVKSFTDDPDILATCLIQNFFGNKKLDEKNIPDKIQYFLRKLDEISLCKTKTDSIVKKDKKTAIIFLFNNQLLLTHTKYKRLLKKKRIKYGMDILQELSIGELRNALEDSFFSYLQPEIYHHYTSLLKYSKKQYVELQKQMKKYFQQLLKKNNIEAQIYTRIKTIHSIHNKVVKKNVLLSQILDTIGLRIIVKTVKECYQTMGLILKDYPIMTCRVKDYITIPKQNGYQSIHLTIVHEGHPTEIQIRTKKMHKYAQYGKACHLTYKKYGTEA